MLEASVVSRKGDFQSHVRSPVAAALAPFELPRFVFGSFLFSEMCAACLNGKERSCLLFACIV